jgi:hypothetical protein
MNNWNTRIYVCSAAAGIALLGCADAYYQGVRQAECTIMVCEEERWASPHLPHQNPPSGPVRPQAQITVTSTSTATASSTASGPGLWMVPTGA